VRPTRGALLVRAQAPWLPPRCPSRGNQLRLSARVSSTHQQSWVSRSGRGPTGAGPDRRLLDAAGRGPGQLRHSRRVVAQPQDRPQLCVKHPHHARGVRPSPGDNQGTRGRNPCGERVATDIVLPREAREFRQFRNLEPATIQSRASNAMVQAWRRPTRVMLGRMGYFSGSRRIAGGPTATVPVIYDL
jgi:hypothetical protein